MAASLLLLTMCRSAPATARPPPRPLITLARRLRLHRLLPLDLHVSYHKGAGVLFILLTIVHTAAHMHNLITNLLVQPDIFIRRNRLAHNPAVNLSSLSVYSWLLTPRSEVFGLVPGWALPSGLLLLLLLGLLLLGALPPVRSRGCFELFAWSHLCYLPLLLLMLLHSPPASWPYLLPPSLLLAAGKLLLLCSTLYRRTSTLALACTALRGSVTRLDIQRSFDFRCVCPPTPCPPGRGTTCC
jgi:hypothetical protein